MKQWITGAALALIAPAAQSQLAARVSSASDRGLMTALVAREDSRAPFENGDVRARGLASANPFIRAYTVRGLGRLENPAATDTIARLLVDQSAEVRAAAADALAQSVARPLTATATADDRASNRTATEHVRAILTELLKTEHDPGVRASAMESIGRLAQGSVDQVKATASAIAPSLAASSVIERRGAIRGIFFLARKREARSAGAIPAPVTDKMYDMLWEPSSGLTPTDRFNIAFALWGAAALNDAQATRMISDRDAFVRERGVVTLARSADTALIRELVARAMVDPQPVVRFRAVNVYAQKLRGTSGCVPLVAMTRDADTTVALGAVDALSGCRGDSSVARLVKSLATALPGDDHWHMAAHAFIALSAVDPQAARGLMPRYATAPNFFVRMYADTAARLIKDTATLYGLSRDPAPNVRASALEALSRVVGHGADTAYLRSLEADDNQVLMAAAAALKGSTLPGVAQRAELRWRQRRARGWDTDIDGLQALDDLVRSFGIQHEATREPTQLRKPLPTFEDLAALETATARIEMMDGSVIIIRFHPFDAPTNVFRFARLARAGTFDGLTFHRVAPFFVVQGPSPTANEYSAPDKPFARDELGVSNVRGTVGLSTRGRDTGDGQIYFNTVDNVWLDHEYTVMGTVASGFEAVERMQEGARIRRITIIER